MKIEIWSDVVCPFCYIGKRRLEQALALFPQRDEVEIIWRSYQLNPNFPNSSEGLNTIKYLQEQKGMSQEEAIGMTKHIQSLGQELDIEINFDIALSVNTRNAHRLIHFANESNLADAMKERLLKAYFTDGINVNNNAQLIALATEIGLDPQKTKAMLESDQYAYEVKQDTQDGVNLGLNGVPFFVFDRKFGIAGAQPLEVFSKTLQQAYDENSNKLIFNDNEGASCDPETGKCE